ncbi:MAG: TIM barrel protein [Chthonomonadales bacterium]
MQIGICSYSFHRMLAAGTMDMFKYIYTCKDLGCTQLDPWNAHLSVLADADDVIHAGQHPESSQHLVADHSGYIAEVKKTAQIVGLPFGVIAVDGAHIYEESAGARMANRERAYRWIEVAAELGAKQVRIDAGGPPEMPEEVFQTIKEGYEDLIGVARPHGIEILVENHWGPTMYPDNVIRLLDEIDGLGLLLDMHNWAPGLRDEGRRRLATRASSTHFKSFIWDDGDEMSEDIPRAVNYLMETQYQGTWGVESVPEDGDEVEGARKTINLLHRLTGR